MTTSLSSLGDISLKVKSQKVDMGAKFSSRIKKKQESLEKCLMNNPNEANFSQFR